MLRRGFVYSCLAAPLIRASAYDDDVTLQAFATALHNNDESGTLKFFDPKMPGYNQLRADLHRLLPAGEINLGIDRVTGLWTLDVIARDLALGSTRRQAKVEAKIEGDRFVSFSPGSFFSAIHGREAWDTIFAFAAEFQNPPRDRPRLEQLDPAMPGCDTLKSGILAMWARWQIEPSLQLLSNEGDDTHRVLEIDWSLSLRDPQELAGSTRREDKVTCKVNQDGRSWKIVSLSPIAFFSAS